MISRCPQCGREVAIPPGVVAEAVVRCPICSAEYPLADALSQLPPLLIVVDPVLAVADSSSAADVTSVQSAATAEEAALLAQQPVADATEGEGPDLFVAADEAGAEAAGLAVGEAAESAEGIVFDGAAAADEAAADEQGKSVVADEAVTEEEFGIAGEEVGEDAEAEGAAALADFARLQEAKPEPSAAAKMRRKKGKNPVWQLGGVIGGAVIGLFMGYYVLNFFWGPQHDYLGIWLPGCAHTAKHRPTWLGGEASADPNGSSQAGGKRNSAAKNTADRRQRDDRQNGKPSGKPADTAAPADTPSDQSPATGGTDSPETMPREPSQPSPAVDDSTKPSPSAGEPAIDPPSVDVPSLDPPKLDPPKLDQPTLDVPSIDAPSLDMPKIDRPTLDAPTLDSPKIDAPKLEDLMPTAPAVDRPSLDEPTLDMPKPDKSKPDEPKPDEPTLDMPKPDEPKPDKSKPDEPTLEPIGPEPSKPDEKSGNEPGRMPSDELPAAPGESPGSGEPAAAPEKTAVGWKNPPHSSTADLRSSLSDAWKVFGCNRCDSTGVVRVDGREQPCPACQGKPPAEITAEVYEKLAAAAARSIHVGNDDPEALDAARAEADRFFAQVGRLGVAEQLGRRAAEQLQSADGPRGGVVLACVMGREFSKEGLFGATVETLGQPHRIGVFSNRSLGVAPGKKVILLGDVMVNPSENLAGAALNKPWIVWVGRVIEIDETN